MLGLPLATEINKQLPKKAIYAKFDLKPAQRDHFDEDVSKLVIVNAISPTTIPALQKGENVECIYVVEVSLKKRDYDPKNIALLSKLIPQKIVFALRHDNMIQLAIYHSKLICGNWQDDEESHITLQGLNMDTVWEGLVTNIGNITIEDGKSLLVQLAFDDARAKLEERLNQIEKRARSEKQPRKRLELFEQIKVIKEQLYGKT